MYQRCLHGMGGESTVKETFSSSISRVPKVKLRWSDLTVYKLLGCLSGPVRVAQAGLEFLALSISVS